VRSDRANAKEGGWPRTLGSTNIIFAIDYPYQFQKQAVQWIDAAPISDDDREPICHGNSERIFKLT
jgi:5-carboxyvanillate decarboxylase